MSLAIAYQFSDVEANPSLIQGATKDCPGCDPDNPRAVRREECQVCAGQGRVKFAAAEIAEELKASRKPGPGASGADGDGDLYLEY